MQVSRFNIRNVKLSNVHVEDNDLEEMKGNPVHHSIYMQAHF